MNVCVFVCDVVVSSYRMKQVCGGFRRGKETLHDVDVLVSFRRGNGEPGHQGLVEVRPSFEHVRVLSLSRRKNPSST